VKKTLCGVLASVMRNVLRHVCCGGSCLLLVGIIFICTSVMAQAQSAIVGQAFYEDPSNQLDFATVRDQTFTPYQGILNKGYSSSTFWIRLDLDPVRDVGTIAGFQQDLFVLRISPSFLDEIELYDPQGPQDKRRITGARYSGADDEYKSPNFNFVFKNLDQPRRVWLRLKSNSSNIILVEALKIPALTLADQQQNLLYGAYFGIILLTLLLSLLIMQIRFDWIVAVFAIKQFATLLWAFFDRGYYRLFFDALPGTMPIADFRNFTSFFVVSTSMYFDYVFLREFNSPKLGQLLQKLLLLVIGFTLLCYIFKYYTLGIKMNMVAITCSILVSFFTALTLPRSGLQDGGRTGDVPKYVVVLCYSLVCILLLPAVLPLLGVTPAANLSLNSLIYHGLLSSIAMAAVLGFRSRSLVVRQIGLQSQLELTQRLAAEERQNRIEQSKFMAMLSHELKTPLSGIRMVVAAQNLPPIPHDQIVNAVEDIDHIVERCLHAERIHERNVRLEFCDVNVDDLLKKICRRHVQSARIKLDIQDVGSIHSDQQILSVVLSNLVDNACKYSPSDTEVTVSAAKIENDGKGTVQIVIENKPTFDDWPDADQLFSKYYRSQNAYRVTGSGLGLYLVDQFTRMLGGTVVYQPVNGKVRFTLALPRSSPAASIQ
jgi:two-component system, sensor histidine kinase LadS